MYQILYYFTFSRKKQVILLHISYINNFINSPDEKILFKMLFFIILVI
jgi:hypothetical protein